MPDREAEAPQRTLHFPEGYRGGWLLVLVGQGEDKRVYSRPRVAPRVSVPEHAEVHFTFRPFNRVDWSGLSMLRPDDLTLLDASSAPVEKPDLAYLRRLTGLRWLNLSGTSLTDDMLQHVAALRNLELLELGSTLVTDQGLEHLRPLENLRQLYLEGTRVGDAALAHLVRLPALQTLSLYATDVTDAGLLHLAEMHSLQYIALQETAVTTSGVARLHEALPGCEIALHWEEEEGTSRLTEKDLAIFPYAERAREAAEAQIVLHEKANARDQRHSETIAAWHNAVDVVYATLSRAYPPGFWELVGLLQRGDPRGLEQALRFLEEDPWFFRSGYVKERLLRYVRRVPWSPEHVARLQSVVIAVVQTRDRREFRHYCSLAKEIRTPGFRERVALLLDHGDPGVRRRAQWMLDAVDGHPLPPGRRKRWPGHGRTRRWMPRRSPIS